MVQFTRSPTRCHLLRMVLVSIVCLLPNVAAAQSSAVTVAWDPSPDPHATGYQVYVGTEPGIYSERHDAGDVTSFRYEAASGGPYYFAIAAYSAGGVEGARSMEVASIALMGPSPPIDETSSDTAGSSSAGAGSGEGSRPTTICDEVAHDCLRVLQAAETDQTLDGLASTPDGRIFVVEGGTRVRVASDAGWIAAPALTLDTPDTSIEALVVDPRFSSTRRVFASHIDRYPDGSRRLSIVRYREVQDRLGEPAAVIAGLPLPPAGRAPFTVDSAGRIYVAMPGWETGRDPYSATVLRFEGDGTVPRTSRSGSPILAAGFRRPTALTWDPQGAGLLLAGTDDRYGVALAQIPVDDKQDGVWPLIPATTALGTPRAPVGVVPSLASPTDASAGYALALPEALHRRDTRLTWSYPFADLGEITALTGYANGVMYVVVRPPGQAAPSRLFALRPDRP